jgi:hypothetical protein
MGAIRIATYFVLVFGYGYVLYAIFKGTGEIPWYPAILLAIVIYAILRGAAEGWFELDEPNEFIPPGANRWQGFASYLKSRRMTRLLLPLVCITALICIFLLHLRYEQWTVSPPFGTMVFFGSVLVFALLVSYIISWRN